MLKEFFKNVKIKRLKKKILNLKKEECSRRGWWKIYQETEICNCCGEVHNGNHHYYLKVIADQIRIEINFLEEELRRARNV